MSGLSSRATVTVGSMLVLGLGLRKTGLVAAIGAWARTAPLGGKYSRMFTLCLVCALLSPFLMTTAVVMVFLPVWAIFYVGMLEPPDSTELVLADNGAAVYSTCASCHGADGSGTATGRQLNDGELLLTFGPAPGFDGLAHHLSWVYLGTAGTKRLGLDIYGNPDRPDGPREVDSFASGMSGFANLSLEDLVSVVYYERVVHGGIDAATAALEEEMLLALVADAPPFETGSPDEISALLTESALGHGIDLAAGE